VEGERSPVASVESNNSSPDDPVYLFSPVAGLLQKNDFCESVLTVGTSTQTNQEIGCTNRQWAAQTRNGLTLDIAC
jgi:hypothetical protein